MDGEAADLHLAAIRDIALSIPPARSLEAAVRADINWADGREPRLGEGSDQHHSCR